MTRKQRDSLQTFYIDNPRKRYYVTTIVTMYPNYTQGGWGTIDKGYPHQNFNEHRRTLSFGSVLFPTTVPRDIGGLMMDGADGSVTMSDGGCHGLLNNTRQHQHITCEFCNKLLNPKSDFTIHIVTKKKQAPPCLLYTSPSPRAS